MVQINPAKPIIYENEKQAWIKGLFLTQLFLTIMSANALHWASADLVIHTTIDGNLHHLSSSWQCCLSTGVV